MRETNHFGEQVREKRKEMGLTVDGLAAKIHITGSYLSNIEIGKAPPPSPPVIELLEEVLQLPAHSLFQASDRDGFTKAPTKIIRDFYRGENEEEETK